MDIIKRLGSYGIPLMYLIGGFALYQQFGDIVSTVGIKAISMAAFFAFFLWSIWYLTVFKQSDVVNESGQRQLTLLHKNKFGKLYAYIVPAFFGILALLPWLKPSETNYSEYFKQGSELG